MFEELEGAEGMVVASFSKHYLLIDSRCKRLSE